VRRGELEGVMTPRDGRMKRAVEGKNGSQAGSPDRVNSIAYSG